jgi:hypothetical protein
MNAVAPAFFGSKSIDGDLTLRRLAQRGFLMVDTIPFAMQYKSRRSREGYNKLVMRTSRSYMHAKLESSRLLWSSDLRVAFSVPLNARRVISGLDSVLKLGGQDFPLSEDMVACDGSHYPSADRVRGAFRLDPKSCHL